MPKKYTTYTDAQRSAAMITLALNKFDYEKTEIELGIDRKVLQRWDKELPKRMIPEMLEEAIGKLFDRMPAKFTEKAWGITLGILLDKYLLVNNQPNSRLETTINTVINASEEEKAAIIAEAERILASRNFSGSDPSTPPTPED